MMESICSRLERENVVYCNEDGVVMRICVGFEVVWNILEFLLY